MQGGYVCLKAVSFFPVGPSAVFDKIWREGKQGEDNQVPPDTGLGAPPCPSRPS